MYTPTRQAPLRRQIFAVGRRVCGGFASLVKGRWHGRRDCPTTGCRFKEAAHRWGCLTAGRRFFLAAFRGRAIPRSPLSPPPLNKGPVRVRGGAAFAVDRGVCAAAGLPGRTMCAPTRGARRGWVCGWPRGFPRPVGRAFTPAAPRRFQNRNVRPAAGSGGMRASRPTVVRGVRAFPLDLSSPEGL